MGASTAIQPKHVRYIKLGRGGEWENISLDRGELHFSHHLVPHEMALSGDREGIREHLIAAGRDPAAASGDAREILDFYTLGEDCLWVTIAREQLWWTFAEPEVDWLGPGPGHGARIRRCTTGAWRNTDIAGRTLDAQNLSSRLTSIASYRRTICRVQEADYLMGRINASLGERAIRTDAALAALLDALVDTIAILHWRDFETLADLVLARSGWHRISPVGGTQKLFDIVLEQFTTEERAAVQVKSRATQGELEEFVELADAAGLYDRLYFICHSPPVALLAPEGRGDVHVLQARELAVAVLRTGLADWVRSKAA